MRKINITKEVKFSEKTMELLKERIALITEKSKTQENRNKISELSKQIRETIRRERKLKSTKKLEEEIQRTGVTRKAFKELRECGKEWITKLKSNKSKQVTNRRSIQYVATNYYRTLYSNNDTERENNFYEDFNISCKNVPSILAGSKQSHNVTKVRKSSRA